MIAALFILLCLIWGSTWIAIKLGVSEAPPLILSGIRFCLSVGILSVLVFAKKAAIPSTWREKMRLAYPGIFFYGISYAFLYTAETKIDSALAAILFAAFPFYVAALSHLMLGTEPLAKRGWAGLAIGFAGVILISYDAIHTSTDLFLGTVFTLVGAFSSAYGMILHKKNVVNANIYTAAAFQMGLGGIIVLAIGMILEDISSFPINAVTVGTTLYLSIFGSVIAFLIYYYLLTKVKAVTLSLVAFITPLVAVAIGVLAFEERLSILILIGSALILSGVFLVVKK